MKKSVAVVGSGISGLATAWAFARAGWEVTVLEAGGCLGGHSLTVDSSEDGKGPRVDLGFQVMNRTTYPYLSAMFNELGVDTEPSDMSFAVSMNDGELEWASHGLGSVFAQPGNAISPSFLNMIREMFRFSSLAEEVLKPEWSEPSMGLGEYLKLRGFNEYFTNNYLLPMTNAVWSVSASKMMEFPVVPLMRFWSNHHLINPLGDRPRWRVVKGRTEAYVKSIEAFLSERGAKILLNSPVARLVHLESSGKVQVHFKGDDSAATPAIVVDHVVLATHAPTSAEILQRSSKDLISERELELIGSIPYETNDVLLHTDVTQMPKLRKAWAAWNVLDRSSLDRTCNVCCTYWLNLLQNLPEGTRELFCTLNPITPIPESAIISRYSLEHPIFSLASVSAQNEINQLQAKCPSPQSKRIWFAGAYLGSGFHEDGMRSALAVAKALGAAPEFVEVEYPALQLVRGPSPVYTRTQRITVQLFESLASELITQGHLRVVLPCGNEIGPFGRRTKSEAVSLNEPVAELWIQDVDALLKMVKDSDIGIGEAYMDGMISTDKGGILNLVEILARNLSAESLGRLNRAPRLGDSLTKAAALLLYQGGNLWNNVKHRLRKNTVEGSRKNIQAHYDIGNPLYELFLDETLTYSSGIHTSECGADQFSVYKRNGDEPLPLYEAQLAKLDAIIARAGLKKSDVVLEIGCGWGSLAIRAAETIGCLVIGITISTEQYKIAVDRVKERGLDALVDLRICDYRKLGIDPDLPPPAFFDKIISCEMLEAVGHENLPVYFETCDRMLKPNGTALIQVIGIPDERYEDYCKGSDFIREHVFPGGHLPAFLSLDWANENTQLSLEQADDIGPDYAITLRMWRERFLARRAEVISMGYPERFIRMWEFYLAYCEVGFRNRVIHDWHLRYVKKDLSAPGAELPENLKKTSLALSSAPGRDPKRVEAALSAGKGLIASSPKPKSLSDDKVTQILFTLWVLTCALAVNRLGSQVLAVPITMTIVALLHFAAGAVLAAPNVTPKARKASSDRVLLGCNSLAAFFGLSQLYLANSQDEVSSSGMDSEARYNTIVLVGLGLLGGDLFSIVAGGYHKHSGVARIVFLTAALSLVSVAIFFATTLLTLAGFITIDQAANIPSLYRNVLASKGYTMKSLHYQFASYFSLLVNVMCRFSIHLYLTYLVVSDYLSPESESSSKWYLYGAGCALCWDVFSLFTQIVRIREDLENRSNTLDLIASKPDTFLKPTSELVSTISTKF